MLLVTDFCISSAQLVIEQDFTESPAIGYKRLGNTFSFFTVKDVCNISYDYSLLTGQISEKESIELRKLITDFSNCFCINDELQKIPNVQFGIKVTSNTPFATLPLIMLNLKN